MFKKVRTVKADLYPSGLSVTVVRQREESRRNGDRNCEQKRRVEKCKVFKELSVDPMEGNKIDSVFGGIRCIRI